MKQFFWTKCIICILIVFLIGAGISPHILSEKIAKVSSENNEKITEDSNDDAFDGICYNCRIDITFTDAVRTLPIGLPIPLFAVYVYMSANGYSGKVEIDCVNEYYYDEDAFIIEFILFGFIGSNTIIPLIDFDGGRIVGYTPMAVFHIK